MMAIGCWQEGWEPDLFTVWDVLSHMLAALNRTEAALASDHIQAGYVYALQDGPPV